MALIICSECGKEFSDKAGACPNCGCPVSEMEIKEQPNTAQESNLRCPKCKGKNIEFQFQEIEQKHKGKAEVKKKSAVTRAGNSFGRAAMIGMTGGLWALTPKKSDYKEVSSGKTKIKHQKIAVCQDCGKSWHVF